MELVRHKTHLNPTDKLQLLLAKVERVARLDVGETGPSLGDLNAVKEILKGVTGSWAHDFLAIDVVTNMRVTGEGVLSPCTVRKTLMSSYLS